MANTVENTFRKIGNTLEYIFNGGTTEQPITNTNGMGKPSNLEMYGRQARGYHLMRNEWKKDIQYTRSLVNAEYMIQTEFKIDSGVGEDVIEEDTRTKDQKKIDKLEKKKQKIQTKIDKLQGNQTQPKENIAGK
jgi:hypothetical protein